MDFNKILKFFKLKINFVMHFCSNIDLKTDITNFLCCTRGYVEGVDKT